MMKLTVTFIDDTGDKRILSGKYPLLCCLERIEQMEKLPNFKGYKLERA